MKKIFGCLVAVVFLAAASLVFAQQTVHFPIWQQNSDASCVTNIFVRNTTGAAADADITIYSVDGLDSMTTSATIAANGVWVCLGSQWITAGCDIDDWISGVKLGSGTVASTTSNSLAAYVLTYWGGSGFSIPCMGAGGTELNDGNTF